jgi:hypothetical protein
VEFNNSTSWTTNVSAFSPSFEFSPYPLAPGKPATVRVKLASQFPHDVTGSVSLDFTPDPATAVQDPAVQLATGGRVAIFRVPAYSLLAHFDLFGIPAEELGFQTGTIAGTIAFTGTYEAGAIRGSFTPVSWDGLEIPADTLSIAAIEEDTHPGFSVSVLVLSTSRRVSQLSLTFNTSPRVRLSCGHVNGCLASGNTLMLDVSSAFAQWFDANIGFGGLAQLRLPLQIQGSVTGSVAVTLRNDRGISNTLSFRLP